MTQELEMLDTLKELRSLYKNGELRELDFDARIASVQKQIEHFEKEMEEQFESWSFFKDFDYVPTKEV